MSQIPDVPAAYLVLLDYVREKHGEALADELRAVYDEASRRAQRASRLRGFADDLKRFQKRLDSMRAQGHTDHSKAIISLNGQIAYRQQCLDRADDYLNGWTPDDTEPAS